MLDAKMVRNNPEQVREGLRKRRLDIDIDAYLALDAEWRALLQESEQLKNKRNVVSEEIAARKRGGEDAGDQILEMREVSQKIKEFDEKIKEAEDKLQKMLLMIPNIPHESVPGGTDEGCNVEVRKWGTPPEFDFELQAHWDLGERCGIIDFERGTKVTGARFTFYKGAGARLERALVNFMLDLHTEEHGYQEIFPPFIVNCESMTGTGQLPKFAEDMFKLEGTDYYLIPTAEVPVTNLYRDEILEGDKLPIYHAAYSACFRAEAGAAGRDTRGLIRQHQFNKVEMVKFVKPETSYDELEKLVRDAEDVLQRLGIPYRVVSLCSGDLGFSAAKCYDVEVWMPSYNSYKEISSCSNFEDFQARRANIKYRAEARGKAQYVHTLNGSGVAVGRTVAAILENYQQPDGSFKIPEALRPYMGGLETVEKQRSR